MRFVVSAFAVVLMCACSQPAPSAPGGAPAPAPIDYAAKQAQVAALPAPYNQASYEAGRAVFAQCRSCHTTAAGAGNRVGPNLHGVFGREIGAAANFNYSQAVQAADFRWDGARLDEWLANPQTFLPGNRMAFAGVRREEDRRDVIAYLMVETAE